MSEQQWHNGAYIHANDIARKSPAFAAEVYTVKLITLDERVEKVDGFIGVGSDIVFNAEGKFLQQNIWK